MKIMQYEPVNEGRHPWREAIKTQIPTVIVATFMAVGFLIGVYVGASECTFDRAYTNTIQQSLKK